MKKIAKICEVSGALLALTCMCIDVAEHPIAAIPIAIGWITFYIGTKIDGEWINEEEIVENDGFVRGGTYIDGDVEYISYDSCRTERYMDFR